MLVVTAHGTTLTVSPVAGPAPVPSSAMGNHSNLSASWPASRPSSIPARWPTSRVAPRDIGFHALVIPDHLIAQLTPVPAMRDRRGRHGDAPDQHVRAQQRPPPPRRARPGPGHARRPQRRADSTSRSARAGTGPSTPRSACRSTRPRSRGRAAGRGGHRAQGLLRRRPVLVRRSSTTRSPTTTPSRSRCSSRTRRSSSAVAVGAP